MCRVDNDNPGQQVCTTHAGKQRDEKRATGLICRADGIDAICFIVESLSTGKRTPATQPERRRDQEHGKELPHLQKCD